LFLAKELGGYFVIFLQAKTMIIVINPAEI